MSGEAGTVLHPAGCDDPTGRVSFAPCFTAPPDPVRCAFRPARPGSRSPAPASPPPSTRRRPTPIHATRRARAQGVAPRLSLRDYVHQHKTEFIFFDVGRILIFLVLDFVILNLGCVK